MGKEKAYVCKLCGEVCFNEDECLRHVYEKHPEEFRELVRETGVKVCPRCGWPVVEQEDVFGSYLLGRQAKMWVCERCHRVIASDYDLAKTVR